ncbi:15-hydroxyprostaglandin dehydrogenase [NAD(+)]-like [Hyposmocoma kahamanoa]|uniref:15-hydroxyprostaglandin dehydrogenase [NAD(+)]-like n=1 Tax=Hyposmocoma kahamanoa TaxID=1477025 RepID=UPI000E6D8A8A|nr:15-hydroxyprostaglandin dehydrogenase [NAD(+)]-like [Hyposmocoma kahamanoa]
MPFYNKIVIVTGGADGIGYAICEKFLKSGAKAVIIVDIDDKKGSEAIKNLSKFGNKSVFVKCDVTKDLEEVLKKILEQHNTVDVLVNNAGVVDEVCPKRTLGLNTVALIEWSMKLYEHMRKDKGGNGGTIVNIASVYGVVVDPFQPIYKASKYGVIGFTRTLGHELNFEKFGVRVVAVCPGFTETALGARLIEQEMLLDVRKELNDLIAKMPWQKPDAVGRATVEIFEKADSGTAWSIIGDGPVDLIPGCEISM